MTPQLKEGKSQDLKLSNSSRSASKALNLTILSLLALNLKALINHKTLLLKRSKKSKPRWQKEVRTHMHVGLAT